MGSVKDLQAISPPSKTKMGEGEFVFSDRYSVFDWGEMPDHIDGKGAALCMLSSFFFEQLEKKGIPTHFMGLVENGQLKKFSQMKGPSNRMHVKVLRVVR